MGRFSTRSTTAPLKRGHLWRVQVETPHGQRFPDFGVAVLVKGECGVLQEKVSFEPLVDTGLLKQFISALIQLVRDVSFVPLFSSLYAG